MSRRCAVILIGRNEGNRLASALSALDGYAGQVIYVDSDSSDGSVELAKQRGAEVVELDPSTPLSASRGRNAGFNRAIEIDPELAFIHFVDGDCEMAAGWIELALQAMDKDETLAVVCGRLRERRPEVNLYHRLLDQEWETPPGEVLSSGGIAMMRVAVLQKVGLFNPSLKAGEEPELCMRIRENGGKIMRLGDTMAYHDAGMSRLSQWWQRGKRTGHGGLDVYWHTRRSEKLFGAMLRRALAWTLGWLVLLAVVPTAAGILIGPIVAALLAIFLLLVQSLQWLRLAAKQYAEVGSWPRALGAAGLQMIDKWAQLHGIAAWLWGRLTRRHQHPMELQGVTKNNPSAIPCEPADR